jgi:hypothetical protein
LAFKLPLESIREEVGMIIKVLLIEDAPEGGEGDGGSGAGSSYVGNDGS